MEESIVTKGRRVEFNGIMAENGIGGRAAMRRWMFAIALCQCAAIGADTVEPPSLPPEAAQQRFTFVRVQYDSIGGYGESWYHYDGRDWERWETDYPEAEENFLIRLKELTTIDVNPKPTHIRLTDPMLFDYPLIYMCDPGWQLLTDDEVKALRIYLERGGFLWIDDFWGIAEWQNLEEQMLRVFPDLKWGKIPATHPIFSMVFPLKECPQVPAKIFYDMTGETYDIPDGHREPVGGIAGVKDTHFMGLFKDGRLMAVATHNNDIGDGWERETEGEEFFRIFSTKSYALSVNILVYALTH